MPVQILYPGFQILNSDTFHRFFHIKSATVVCYGGLEQVVFLFKDETHLGGTCVFVDILNGFLNNAVEVDLDLAVDLVPFDLFVVLYGIGETTYHLLFFNQFFQNGKETFLGGKEILVQVMGNIPDLFLNVFKFADVVFPFLNRSMVVFVVESR